MQARWRVAVVVSLSALVAVGCTRAAEPVKTVNSAETRTAEPTRTASPSETPTAAPPAGTIVFGRWDPAIEDQVLFTVSPDGSDLHQVIPGKPVATQCPHWFPDGSRILACSRKGVAQIINPATGSSRIVGPSPLPGVLFGCSRMSPDGKRLECGRYDQSAGLYSVRSSDLRDLRRITSNPGRHRRRACHLAGWHAVVLRKDGS